MISAQQNRMIEIGFTSAAAHGDPFNEVTLDVVFRDPSGDERQVPAFWARGRDWKVRYASPVPGRHTYRTVCSDPGDAGLHGLQGQVEVTPYRGENPLFVHGPLRVSQSRRHLEHRDGTPFFWLGDTWWHGTAGRFQWPEDVRALTADRVAKGFTVIQIVGGLLPEITQDRFWSEWTANEGGWAWEREFARINPTFFDQTDLRIGHLVQSGLVPCVVGAWGYYLTYMGLEKMKRHWRYLVARYGAYPVVWCLAGETTMPPYEDDREDLREDLHAGWSQIDGYVRETDPFGHPLTLHLNSFQWTQPRDLVDVDMLQCGHTYWTLAEAVRAVHDRIALAPRLPVLIGEVCYEGEYGANWQDVQRLLFWNSMLGGAAGHTYGANGIWQFRCEDHPFIGLSSYGDQMWQDAMVLPGSRQLGIGKKLLQRFPWWQFEPRREPNWDEASRISPCAAGIPGKVWVIYLPSDAFDPVFGGLKGRRIAIEPGAAYRAHFVDPRTGEETDLGPVTAGADGLWPIPEKRTKEDMLLVLEARNARVGATPAGG